MAEQSTAVAGRQYVSQSVAQWQGPRNARRAYCDQNRATRSTPADSRPDQATIRTQEALEMVGSGAAQAVRRDGRTW